MYDVVLLLKHNTMSCLKGEIKMVQQISDAEFEIMKVVWANGEKPTLFASLTADLAAKGKPWQEYTPLVSDSDYRKTQTKNFLYKIYEGDAKWLVSDLISGDLLTDEEYEELKKLLEKGRTKK